jgi:hypothetical protein
VSWGVSCSTLSESTCGTRRRTGSYIRRSPCSAAAKRAQQCQSPFRFSILAKLGLQKTRDASRNLLAVIRRWQRTPGICNLQERLAPDVFPHLLEQIGQPYSWGPQPRIPGRVHAGSGWCLSLPRQNVEFGSWVLLAFSRILPHKIAKRCSPEDMFLSAKRDLQFAFCRIVKI